jgi:GntR family transcriptional regulator
MREVMLMSLITIDYRDRKLIYEQLIDNIKELILRGDLKKDDFLPSVRSLAKELGIPVYRKEDALWRL